MIEKQVTASAHSSAIQMPEQSSADSTPARDSNEAHASRVSAFLWIAAAWLVGTILFELNLVG